MTFSDPAFDPFETDPYRDDEPPCGTPQAHENGCCPCGPEPGDEPESPAPELTAFLRARYPQLAEANRRVRSFATDPAPSYLASLEAEYGKPARNTSASGGCVLCRRIGHPLDEPCLP
jgi:hypothetical protein